MDNLFFDDWQGIYRVITSTLVAYFLVVVMLRISGKRTLAKMNAFDFIVTIALGSILGSVILNKKIPLTEGLCAILLLIILQFCITFISVRSKSFKNFISSNPTLLYYNGEILHQSLRKERVPLSEVNKSVREAGFSSFSLIEAIILESTGDITVISKSETMNTNAMKDVQSYLL